jgi:hypothetical protein
VLLVCRKSAAAFLLIPSSVCLYQPDAVAAPVSVVVTGSLQSELGCTGDFQPTCIQTGLVYDATDDVWQSKFGLPVGNFSYFAALNGGFAETYGANGGTALNPIKLDLASPRDVKFYYNHRTHWLTDNVNSTIVVLAGNFQSELGCISDFDPTCLRSWLQDIDGDGIYSLTADLPDGSYSTIVTVNESFNERYGLGGIANGANIEFAVNGGRATFCYDSKSHILDVGTGACTSAGPPGSSVPEPGAISLVMTAFVSLYFLRVRKSA